MAYQLQKQRLESAVVSLSDDVDFPYRVNMVYTAINNVTFAKVPLAITRLIVEPADMDQAWWNGVWDDVKDLSDQLFPDTGIDPDEDNPVAL